MKEFLYVFSIPEQTNKGKTKFRICGLWYWRAETVEWPDGLLSEVRAACGKWIRGGPAQIWSDSSANHGCGEWQNLKKVLINLPQAKLINKPLNWGETAVRKKYVTNNVMSTTCWEFSLHNKNANLCYDMNVYFVKLILW